MPCRDGQSLVGDRITLVIAHRLSTIKNASFICVFNCKKTAEVGTHAELIAQGGIYQSMCKAQALNYVASVPASP